MTTRQNIIAATLLFAAVCFTILGVIGSGWWLLLALATATGPIVAGWKARAR